MGAPKISVLMPVYNGEDYLKEAIDSILNQTLPDFEFIIVNDGSTDRTDDIVKTYRDPRIRFVENEKNMGLIRSLNKGLELAEGAYIARMDSDDISLPERLSIQASFLDTHPEVGVCGTWAKIIDEKGNVTGALKPLSGDAVRKLFWRPSSVLHPTCMIRAKLLKDHRYSLDYPHAEDYELWLRLYSKTDFYNLDRFLLLYRVHPAGIGRTQRELQLSSSYKAFSAFMANDKISYEEYLSLIPVEARINPIRRAYSWWLASARTEFDAKLFLIDNLIYTKLWLAKRWI
jgi:glycosyltransferase involved in cell wall biosynthesis